MNAYELGIVEGMEKVASKATDAAIGATTGSVLGWEIAKDHGMKKGKGALLGAALAVPVAVYLGPKIRKKMRKEAERSGAVPMAKTASEVDSAINDLNNVVREFASGVGPSLKETREKGQKIVANINKPRPPIPNKTLGLGALGIGTMAIGAMALKRRQQKLQQPPRPPRY